MNIVNDDYDDDQNTTNMIFFQSFRFQSAAHTALIKIIMIICSDYLSRSESNSKAILAEECFALKQFRSLWSMVIILDGKLILMVSLTMFRWSKQNLQCLFG